MEKMSTFEKSETLEQRLVRLMEERRRVWDGMYRMKKETGSEYWQINESVPSGEMESLLQKHFGHYERLDLQGKIEGSIIPAFIVRVNKDNSL